MAVPLPAGVDCVALVDKDIKEARECKKPFVRTRTKESVIERARQTPYGRGAVINKKVWDVAMNDITGLCAELALQKSVDKISREMASLEEKIRYEVKRQKSIRDQTLASLAEPYEWDQITLLLPASAQRTDKELAKWNLALERRNHIGYRLLESRWGTLKAPSTAVYRPSKPRPYRKRKPSVVGAPEEQRASAQEPDLRGSKRFRVYVDQLQAPDGLLDEQQKRPLGGSTSIEHARKVPS